MNDTEKKNHIENMSFMCGEQKIDVDLNKLRRQYWPFVKTTGMGNWIQLPPTSEKCPSYLGAKDTDNLLFKSRFRVPDAEYAIFTKKIVNKEYDNEEGAFVDPQGHHLYRVCQPECADTTRCTSEEIKEQCTYFDSTKLTNALLPDGPQKAKEKILPLLGCEGTPNTFSNYCVESLKFIESAPAVMLNRNAEKVKSLDVPTGVFHST